MTLQELQDRYLAAMHESRAAADNSEASLWRQVAESLINLIGLRMDRGDEGHDGWESRASDSTVICGETHVMVSQQLLHTPVGYIGTNRYTLTTGRGTDAVSFTSHSKTLLRASLDAYLDRHNASDDMRTKLASVLRD